MTMKITLLGSAMRVCTWSRTDSVTLKKRIPMLSITRYFAVFLVGLLSFPCLMAEEDWPTWRHNAGRTNISTEKIPAPLRLQWKRQLLSLIHI